MVTVNNGMKTRWDAVPLLCIKFPTTMHTVRVWKHRQRETPGPPEKHSIGGCVSPKRLLRCYSSFPEESLIHCWSGLLLCCVSASEQCVERGYLPRLVGERSGQAPEGLDKHHVTTNQQTTSQQPVFSPSVFFSSLFDLLRICPFKFL